MGNSHPQQPSFLLDAKTIQDWNKVQEKGYGELWINKKTNQQLQAYPIPQSLLCQSQLQKYQFRKNHRQHLAVVEAIVSPSNSSFCSEPKAAYALVQNITARLGDFKKKLSFQQALYVLSAAATGYNTLNSFFGPLQPNPDMICFNQQGQVKVWLNYNLGLNEPSQTVKVSIPSSEDSNMAQKSTKQRVNKLIRIIEQASLNQFKSPFTQQFRKVSTYFQIANMVSYFCYAYNIQLPANIKVFKNLKNPPVNLQKLMIKKQSQHVFPDNSQKSSRVKTVLFRSSNALQTQFKHQLINPQILRPMDKQNYLKANNSPKISQSIAQSPKITFKIRSNLHTQLNEQKIERLYFGKPIIKTSHSQSDFFANLEQPIRLPQESYVQKRLQEMKTNQPGGTLLNLNKKQEINQKKEKEA